MPVSLSSADLDRLGEAVRLLVSPFDHGDVDRWRSAVMARLRPLLGSDSAGFLLPAPDALPFYSDDHSLDDINRFFERPPPLIDGETVLAKSARLGVAGLDALYEDDLPVYYASEHHNELAAPNHAHDALLCAAAGAGGDGAPPSSLMFWHSRRSGPRFGEREEALLRVLRPAFQAGVRSAVRWAHQRESLVATFDGLGEAVAVADMDGRLVHVTPALEQLLDADTDRMTLRTALRRALDGVSGAERGGGVGTAFERRVRSRSATYALRGCLYGGHVGAPLALVSVDREDAAPSVDALVARFGLTERQAEVALLLAERKSNREVAEALFISPHTARHHTQGALRALGLNDRRDVAGAIGIERS